MYRQSAIARILTKLANKVGEDSHLGEILRGSRDTFVLKASGLLAGFLFTFIIARYWGPDALGVFSLCLTVVTIPTVLGVAGLDTTMVRLIAERSAKGDDLFARQIYYKAVKLVLVFTILLSVATFFFASLIADIIFNKTQLTEPIRIASLSITPMALIMLNSQALRGLKKIREFALIQYFLRFLLPLAALVVLMQFNHGDQVVIVAFVAGIFLLAFGSTVVILRSFKCSKPTSTPSDVKLKYLFSIALPLLMASLVIFIKGRINILMIGIYMSETDVGIFTVALKLATLSTTSVMAVSSIAAPKFAEFYGKSDFSGLETVVKHSAKLMFYTSLPFVILFALFPEFFLGLFGEQIKACVPAFLILIAAYLIYGISGTAGHILQMTGKPVVFQNFVIVSTLINIILNFILIPKFGLNGAAVATLIDMLVWNLSCVFYIRLKYGILPLYFPLVFSRA